MSSKAGLLEGLDIFYGEASNNLARVYARVTGVPGGAEFSLSGFVRGPECKYCKTLPTNTALVDAGAGESLLAQALVPDPCFWSPDVPSRYRVHVDLRRGNSVVESTEREFALRNFGCRGKNFFLEGRRWVLRGVTADNPSVEELPAWREARATLFIENPGDEICREATRIGVVVVPWIGMEQSAEKELNEVRRLAKFGAVPMVLIQSAAIPLETLRRAAPNLVFGLDVGWDSPFLDGQCPSYYTFPGAEFAFVQVKQFEKFARLVDNSPHPVVAWRPIHEQIPFAEARAACDVLQRDLAPFGDYAGYVV
jgi:hypothetical protein